MTLTKRLAREARKLAFECAEGTAPDFGYDVMDKNGDEPCCALGHVAFRATHIPSLPSSRSVREAWDLVAEANDKHAPLAERHARLVFPLLMLADGFEVEQ